MNPYEVRALGHPSGYLGAGMVASIERYLVEGESLEATVKRSRKILTRWKGYEETLNVTTNALELAHRPSPDHIANIRAIGEGWAGEEALAIALYAAMAGETYVDVARIAAMEAMDLGAVDYLERPEPDDLGWVLETQLRPRGAA